MVLMKSLVGASMASEDVWKVLAREERPSVQHGDLYKYLRQLTVGELFDQSLDNVSLPSMDNVF